MTTDHKEDRSELQIELKKLYDKYWSLVWYARSNPNCSDLLPHKEKMLNARARIEEKYPDDVESLRTDNWSHGFNSGCLAAFGFALTALDDSTYICDETEEEVSFGGLDTAMDEFPQLDT